MDELFVAFVDVIAYLYKVFLLFIFLFSICELFLIFLEDIFPFSFLFDISFIILIDFSFISFSFSCFFCIFLLLLLFRAFLILFFLFLSSLITLLYLLYLLFCSKIFGKSLIYILSSFKTFTILEIEPFVWLVIKESIFFSSQSISKSLSISLTLLSSFNFL